MITIGRHHESVADVYSALLDALELEVPRPSARSESEDVVYGKRVVCQAVRGDCAREGGAAIEVKRLFYGDANSVGAAQFFVRDALAETDVPEEVVDSAVVLVSELASNVTLYARTDVRVTVRFQGESLWAEVKNWNSRLPRAFLPPEDATTGRGLQLVNAIASRWGLERDDEGKVVWFELPVARSTSINAAVPSGVSP